MLDMLLKGYLYPSDEEWATLREKGASDAAIKERLNELWGENYFGSSGKLEGFFTAKAGENPRVWLNSGKGDPALEGRELILKIREILNIPEPQEPMVSIVSETTETIQESTQETEPTEIVQESTQKPEPVEIVQESTQEIEPAKPTQEPEAVDTQIVGNDEVIFDNNGTASLTKYLDLTEALSLIEKVDVTGAKLSEVEELALSTITSETASRVIETDQLIGALYWVLQGNQRKSTQGTFKDICKANNWFGKSSSTCYEIGQGFAQIKWFEQRKLLVGETFDPRSDIKANSAWLALSSVKPDTTVEEQEEIKVEVIQTARVLAEQEQSKIEASHVVEAIKTVEKKLGKSITRQKRQRTSTQVVKTLQNAVKEQELATKLLEEQTVTKQLKLGLAAERKEKDRLLKQRETLETELAALKAKAENQPVPQKPKQLELDTLIKKPDEGTAREQLLQQRLENTEQELIAAESARDNLQRQIQELNKSFETAKSAARDYDLEVRNLQKKLEGVEAQSNLYKKIITMTRSVVQTDRPLDEIEEKIRQDSILSKESSLQIILNWRRSLQNIASKCEEKDVFFLSEIKTSEQMQELTGAVEFILAQLDEVGFGNAFFE